MAEVEREIVEAAIQYAEAGLSVIPVDKNKLPWDARSQGKYCLSWAKFQKQRMTPEEILIYFDGAYGIAIVCGEVSGGVECLDIDVKYDLTGELYNDVVRDMQKYLTRYYHSPTFEKTVNNGYHFLYRTTAIEGNQDLAKRPATEEEQLTKKEKEKVLIETRGEGGYFVCYPTPGYTLKGGSFTELSNLSVSERNTLFSICRGHNLVVKQAAPEPTTKDLNGTLTSWQDFNQQTDILDILEPKGYTLIKETAKGRLIKRPGAETPYSGIIFSDTGFLYMHSTSTEFEANKWYSPSNVYATLHHGGDWKAAAKDLYQQGYGEQRSKEADMDISLKETMSCPPAFHNAADLLNRGITEIPTLLGEVFPKKGLIALAGASDVGKSTWIRQFLVWLVAKKEQFCGWPIKAEHHKALYYASEDAAESIAYLLKKQCEAAKIHSGELEGLDFLTDYGASLVDTIEEYLQKTSADCVVIDTFADVFGGELNKTNIVRSFLNQFGQLAERYNTLFIWLHHSGKKTEFGEPSKHNLIGSQGFESKMRLVMELREDYQDSSLRHLCIVKGNYLPRQYKNESYVLDYLMI